MAAEQQKARRASWGKEREDELRVRYEQALAVRVLRMQRLDRR